MAAALLDTNVLFGFRSKYDQYHEPATDILTGIDAGGLPTAHVTNYIVAESLSLIGERATQAVATETLDFLIEGSGFEVCQATRSDFTSGQALFRQYPDLTFVDATTVAYMHREDIEYIYSFDDDFDAIDGVTRLDTAVNPFA
jgi:predicted nucleic acid-binding protein